MASATPNRAQRAVEDLRLQIAVDRLVAQVAMRPEDALRAPGALARVLGERGVIGLDLEALRREARQMRRHAAAQRRVSLAQRADADAQCARAVGLIAAADKRVRRMPAAGRTLQL